MLTVSAVALATAASAQSAAAPAAASGAPAAGPFEIGGATNLEPVGFMPAAAAPATPERSLLPMVMVAVGAALLGVGFVLMASASWHQMAFATRGVARRLSSSRTATIASVAAAVLIGGVYSASAAVAPASSPIDLAPASTSRDHAPQCEVADVPAVAPATAGGTLVTFTIVSPGCLL